MSFDLYNKLSKKCPERLFNMGITEADKIGNSAGLSTCGKISSAGTFTVFTTGRAFNQIRIQFVILI